MRDGFADLVEKLKAEIEGHVSELKHDPAWVEIERLYQTLTIVERVAGCPRTSLPDLLGIPQPKPAGRRAQVTQGEFQGLSPLKAARRYLKRKGGSATLDEIMAEVIEIGGANAMEKDQLRISLSRGKRNIAQLGAEVYELQHSVRGAGGKDRNTVTDQEKS